MENIDTNDNNGNKIEEQKSSETDPKTEDNNSETDNKPKVEDIDIAVEALTLLNHGKRHLLVEDYSSAVLSLQESCQLFDKRFGIGAEECGEAYLYYGTALLELARLEDGIFDGIVHTKLAEMSDEGTEDEEEEEEEEGDSQEETENTEQKTEEKKTDTEEDIEDSDEEKKKLESMETETEDKAVAGQSSSSAEVTTTEECLPSTSKSEPNKKEEEEDSQEDDASNIEVSWEVLCLAKNVFLRYLDKNDNKLKLAETLQKLGEISIEWENNKSAIDILTECLNHRKELLAEDDRLIAETYYHLGIAYSFNNDTENANNCFQSAIEVIETRIGNQKLKLSAVKSDDIESISTIEREIKQLENILPEMKSKIEDSKEQLLNVKEALEREETEKTVEEAIAFKNKELKDKPITDISHLIKRKRQNSGSETTPKKICSNGHNSGDNGQPVIESAANS